MSLRATSVAKDRLYVFSPNISVYEGVEFHVQNASRLNTEPNHDSKPVRTMNTILFSQIFNTNYLVSVRTNIHSTYSFTSIGTSQGYPFIRRALTTAISSNQEIITPVKTNRESAMSLSGTHSTRIDISESQIYYQKSESIFKYTNSSRTNGSSYRGHMVQMTPSLLLLTKTDLKSKDILSPSRYIDQKYKLSFWITTIMHRTPSDYQYSASLTTNRLGIEKDATITNQHHQTERTQSLSLKVTASIDSVTNKTLPVIVTRSTGRTTELLMLKASTESSIVIEYSTTFKEMFEKSSPRTLPHIFSTDISLKKLISKDYVHSSQVFRTETRTGHRDQSRAGKCDIFL